MKPTKESNIYWAMEQVWRKHEGPIARAGELNMKVYAQLNKLQCGPMKCMPVNFILESFPFSGEFVGNV